jgi:SAM-dependent methyltransferase
MSMSRDWESLDRKQIPASYLEVSEVDRRLLQNVELRDRHLLNIGCGIYHISDESFFGKGAKVVSLDLVHSLVRLLKDVGQLPRRRDGAFWDVVQGTGTQLPFGDGSFDVVTSFSAIEHIPEPSARSRVFREIHRVLKPGGYAALTFPNFWFLPGTLLAPVWRSRTGEYEYRYSPRELKRELIRSGLAPLHFDAQTAECLDDAVFEVHLPRFMKRVPGVVLRPALWMLRLSNRSAWLKYTRTRMGFLLQKES